MSDFVEMITAAHKAEQALRITDKETRREDEEAKIAEDLNGLGVTEGFIIEGHTVTFDRGLILQAVYEYHHFEYQVQGVCGKCHQTCWSGGRSTLAGIGEMYHAFEADYRHRCPDKAVSSIEELLKSFIVSVIEEVE